MDLGKNLPLRWMNKQDLPWHSRFDLLGVTFLLFLAASLGAFRPSRGPDATLITGVIFPILSPVFSPGLVDF